MKPKIGRYLNSAKMHFCSKFGNCNFNWWWFMVWTNSKWGKFLLWSSIWPWRSWSIAHKTIEILTKVFNISGPHLVILAKTVDELSRWQTWWRTDWWIDAGNDNIWRPKQALGKKWLLPGCIFHWIEAKFVVVLWKGTVNYFIWRSAL